MCCITTDNESPERKGTKGDELRLHEESCIWGCTLEDLNR